jgi:hypothetical protein
MRHLFGTDEPYYAVIFILFLMVQSGFIAFGFWLVDHLFNLNIVEKVQIH